MSKYLLAGLGNIGSEYAGTRHNIGFDIADACARKHNALFAVDRLAHIARWKVKGRTVICIKPTTFMNLSGKAVKYWMDKEQVPLEHLLVMMDELALPLNKLRLRPGGSAAGHNGLKSIEESLTTDRYARLRFGIGNDYPKGHQAAFVLSAWAAGELPLVKLKVEKCTELADIFVTAGVEQAMNMFNNLEFSL